MKIDIAMISWDRLLFHRVVVFQHGDEIRIEFYALILVMLDDSVAQRRVEMVMLDGFVDLHETGAIHQFRIRCTVNDGSMDGAVRESST